MDLACAIIFIVCVFYTSIVRMPKIDHKCVHIKYNIYFFRVVSKQLCGQIHSKELLCSDHFWQLSLKEIMIPADHLWSLTETQALDDWSFSSN